MEVENTVSVQNGSTESTSTASISVSDALGMIRSELFDADSREVAKYLMKIISNIINNPCEKKYKSLRLSNDTFYKRVGRYKSAVLFLQAAGFKLISKPVMIIGSNKTDDSLEYPSDPEASEHLRSAYEKLCKFSSDDLNLPSSDILALLSKAQVEEKIKNALAENEAAKASAVTATAASEASSFDPFQSDVFRVVPQPRPGGTMLSPTEEKVEILKRTQEKLIEQAGIPERKLTVFMPTGSFNPKKFDASDSYTNSSASSASSSSMDDDAPSSDLTLLKESAAQRRKKMENSEVFRTKAMRELEELKRTKVFTHVVIRVQLPDRCIIQAYFSSQEKTSQIYEVVKSCLAVPPGSGSFYLYSSPPYQVIDPEKTLHNCGLYPSALIYLGWKEEPSKPWVKEELLAKDGAISAIPEVKSVDLAVAAFGESAKPAASSSASDSAAASKAKKGAPKWMKI